MYSFTVSKVDLLQLQGFLSTCCQAPKFYCDISNKSIFFVAPGPFSMSKQDSVNAEERIAQILREAQNAMIQKNTDHPPQNNHRHQSTTQHNNNNNVSRQNL